MYYSVYDNGEVEVDKIFKISYNLNYYANMIYLDMESFLKIVYMF